MAKTFVHKKGGSIEKQLNRLLHKHHTRLTQKGFTEAHSATLLHAAVFLLNHPALAWEANQTQRPLETVEFEAIRQAGQAVEKTYGTPASDAIHLISSIVSTYHF